MNFFAKTFAELSVDELYEIIKSRQQIFLLEQNIVCQDLDYKDKESLHCFFWENGRVSAYLRAFKTGDNTVTVGRVLTIYHRKGVGTRLMQMGVEAIKKHYGCKKIVLHSQKQAQVFYEKIGFEAISDEYLEEGIPHITMEKQL